jgi:hypothetical protein
MLVGRDLAATLNPIGWALLQLRSNREDGTIVRTCVDVAEARDLSSYANQGIVPGLVVRSKGELATCRNMKRMRVHHMRISPIRTHDREGE